MDLEHLSWFDKALILVVAGLAIYAAWSIFSLLWRVPELILAKRELAEAQKELVEKQVELTEAQTRYYNAKADEIESGDGSDD